MFLVHRSFVLLFPSPPVSCPPGQPSSGRVIVRLHHLLVVSVIRANVPVLSIPRLLDCNGLVVTSSRVGSHHRRQLVISSPPPRAMNSACVAPDDHPAYSLLAFQKKKSNRICRLNNVSTTFACRDRFIHDRDDAWLVVAPKNKLDDIVGNFTRARTELSKLGPTGEAKLRPVGHSSWRTSNGQTPECTHARLATSSAWRPWTSLSKYLVRNVH